METTQAIDFETGVGVGSGMIEEEDAEDQDYTAFFRDLHMLSKVEDDVRESVRVTSVNQRPNPTDGYSY